MRRYLLALGLVIAAYVGASGQPLTIDANVLDDKELEDFSNWKQRECSEKFPDIERARACIITVRCHILKILIDRQSQQVKPGATLPRSCS